MYNICPNSPWIKCYDPWAGTPQYHGYREKILIGSYLKPTAIPSNYVGTFGFGGVLKSKRVFVIVILAPVSIMNLHSSGVKETGREV